MNPLLKPKQSTMNDDIVSRTVEVLASLRLDNSHESVKTCLSQTPDEIDQTSSVEELKRFIVVMEGCQSSRRAYYRLNELLLKMIEEEETVDGIKKLYKTSPSSSQAKAQAFLKWHDLSLQEMKDAKNPVEIECVRKKAPESSEARRLYAKRMLEFAKTPQDAIKMWGYDADETIRRIANLLQSEI